MAKSIILGPDGQPIERNLLKRDIAEAQLTGARTAWSHNSIANYLTPSRLSSILQRAAQGDMYDYLTLAEEMEERDPHYASVLGTRKRAVSSIDHEIIPGGTGAREEEIAQAVRDMIGGAELPDIAEDALDALGKSFSATEIIWDTSEGQWMPVRTEWRDPRFFRFDQETGRKLLMLDDANILGSPLPAFKFIVHLPRIKCGLPIRGGLARLASIAYLCKSVALTDWMVFAELFGMPIRVGKYGPNTTPGEKATLRNAVANIGSDAAAIIPQSMQIELLERANSAGSESAYKVLCEWLDKQNSKGILGQTMTTDDGSSQSQANVHNDVRDDIRRADRRQLDFTLNRDWIRPFVDLNYGPQKRYPILRCPIAEPEDIKAITDSLERLVPLGLRVGVKGVLKKLALPEPEKGEEILRPNAFASAPPPDATTETALNREQTSGTDPVDELVDEAMLDWERQMAPIIDPIRALAERSQSQEEFVEALPALLETMDEADLARSLAVEFFKARAIGDAVD